MSNANKFVQAVAGGWGVDGILTLQTGFPIALTTQNNNIHGLAMKKYKQLHSMRVAAERVSR